MYELLLIGGTAAIYHGALRLLWLAPKGSTRQKLAAVMSAIGRSGGSGEEN